jgi:hypothetical protein
VDGIDSNKWKTLLSRANSGELYLDPETGKGLDKVCDTHITRLQNVLQNTDNVSKISGFGGFNSGSILEKKFSALASGDNRSLDHIIKRHIDAVNDVKAVVAKAIANYVALDDEQRAKIEKMTP